MGVIGAAILSLSASSGESSHLIGDTAALSGAAANGASLTIGRRLLLAPYHVPVFTYSCVVTGVHSFRRLQHCSARGQHGFRPYSEWHQSNTRSELWFISAGTAGVLLSLLSIAADGARPLALGAGGVFGWLQREYLLKGIYLSVGPGLFGHVGFNVSATLESCQYEHDLRAVMALLLHLHLDPHLHPHFT